MFYSRLLFLCSEREIKITNVISELKLSSGNLSKWKAGGAPKGDTLCKIADYFGVSTDYLLGRTGEKVQPTTELDEKLDRNVILISGRDGSLHEYEVSDGQKDLVKQVLDNLKPAEEKRL